MPSRPRWTWPARRRAGATVYVTLEPCCHWGRTPPCTDALISAGVRPRGDRDRAIPIRGWTAPASPGCARPASRSTKGVLRPRPTRSAAGFRTRVRHGRPLVTLKLASTLDGRIATRTGESHWITGEAARRAAHALRGRHDAVMVGVGTVLADDPELTCRSPAIGRTPVVRVVADSHLRTPLTAHAGRDRAASADLDPDPRGRRPRRAGAPSPISASR